MVFSVVTVTTQRALCFLAPQQWTKIFALLSLPFQKMVVTATWLKFRFKTELVTCAVACFV